MKYTILALLGLMQHAEAVSVHVTHPKDLKMKFSRTGFIKTGFGVQGHVDYGEGFLGKLYYPTSNTHACQPIKAMDFKNDPFAFKNDDEESNDKAEKQPILLIDAGGCSHALKSHNAEEFGFRATLISASDDEYKKITEGEGALGLPEKMEEKLMIQDRTIPEFIIENSSSAKLKTYVDETASGAIHLKIDLRISHPDNTVDVALYFSSLLDIPDSLFEGMHDYHKMLGNDVQFEPRISTFSCEDCPKDIKERDCISDGKYCPFPPTHDNFQNEASMFGKDIHFTQWEFQGRDVLMQAIRYKCMWEYACKEDRKTCPDLFFLMLHQQRTTMIMYDGFTPGQKSISEAVSMMHFSDDVIQNCLDNSFLRKGDYETDNKFLKKDREAAFSDNVHVHPAMTINKQIYMGDFDPTDMTHAICAGFKERPAHCKRKYIKEFLVNRDDWEIPEYGDSIVSELIFIGFIVIIINILLLGFCKWRQNQGDDKAVVEMEVNQAVQNYFALRGEEINSTHTSEK